MKIERFSTGDQNAQIDTGAKWRFNSSSARCYQVFAIVQHKQEFPGLEGVREHVHQRAARLARMYREKRLLAVAVGVRSPRSGASRVVGKGGS